MGHKKAPKIESGITLEQTVKLLEHLIKTVGELSLKVSGLEKGKPKEKPVRSDEELEIQIYKYLLHRRYKHPHCGLWKCVNQAEWNKLEKEMGEIIKEN